MNAGRTDVIERIDALLHACREIAAHLRELANWPRIEVPAEGQA